MTKIHYVGVKKDGETAFARECGIDRFMPGSSVDVADANLAQRMLRHPDVFSVDAPKKQGKVAAEKQPAATTEANAPDLNPTATTSDDDVFDTSGITLAAGQAVGANEGQAAASTEPAATKPAAKKATAKKAAAKKAAAKKK